MVMTHARCVAWCFFFFNDTATTEIYTLSLHDALPICDAGLEVVPVPPRRRIWPLDDGDRKSTRLNSSHGSISYAVFCLKKTKKRQRTGTTALSTYNTTQHCDTHHAY